MQKRRTYNPRLVRKNHAYSIQEIATCFGVHKNAVHRWVKEGLMTIDNSRPHLIHGSDLIAFLTERQKVRKHTCQSDEFYCCKCRQPRKAWGRMVDLTQLKRETLTVKALCDECQTSMHRFHPAKNLPRLQEMFIIQTVSEEHLNQSFNLPVKRDLQQEARS